MEHSHNHNESGNGQGWLFSRTGFATLVAVSVLGFLVYEGHGAHLLGSAPFLLILVCPLMHIFMHGGHGGHQHGGNNAEENTPRQPESQQAVNVPQAADMQKPGQPVGNNNPLQHQHKHGGC